MGSPQTLIDFVTWARTSYPSRRVALALGPRLGLVARQHDARRHQQRYAGHGGLRGRLEAVDGVDMVGMETSSARPSRCRPLPRGRQSAGGRARTPSGTRASLRPGARQAGGRPRWGARSWRRSWRPRTATATTAGRSRALRSCWTGAGTGSCGGRRARGAASAGIEEYRSEYGAAYRDARPRRRLPDVRATCTTPRGRSARSVDSRTAVGTCGRRDEVVEPLSRCTSGARAPGGDERRRPSSGPRARAARSRGELQSMAGLRLLRLRTPLHESHVLGRLPHGLGWMSAPLAWPARPPSGMLGGQ